MQFALLSFVPHLAYTSPDAGRPRISYSPIYPRFPDLLYRNYVIPSDRNPSILLQDCPSRNSPVTPLQFP